MSSTYHSFWILLVPGLHLRSSGDDCRMPAEGGVPSSESAHRDRLQRHSNHAGHGGHCYDPEYARMESWLDEHPDFVQDYFLRYDLGASWNFAASKRRVLIAFGIRRFNISIRRAISRWRNLRRRSDVVLRTPRWLIENQVGALFRFRIAGNDLK